MAPRHAATLGVLRGLDALFNSGTRSPTETLASYWIGVGIANPLRLSRRAPEWVIFFPSDPK